MIILKKAFVVAAAMCLTSVSVLKASNEPLIIEQPKNMAECVGGANTLKVTLKEGVKAHFQWQKSSNNRHWTSIENAIEATFKPEANTVGKMWYRVVINTEGDNSEPIFSQSAEVTIAEAVAVRVETPKKSAICIDEKLTLIAIPTGGTGECSLQWQVSTKRGEWTDIKGETANTLLISHNLESNHNYRAIYKCNGNGCCN